MTILYFILTLLGILLQYVAKKSFGNKFSGGVYTFSAFVPVVAGLGCLVSAGGSLNFDIGIIPYSIAFAVSFAVTIIASVLAVKTGPLSLTALITSFSLLIPTFYGVIALGEKVGVFFYVGIFALVISLFFSNYSKNESHGKITKEWAIYVFLAFLGNGICATVQKNQQNNMGTELKDEFMLVAYIFSGVILFIMAALFERREFIPAVKRGWFLFTLYGAANAVANICIILLAARMPASVMFPIISAGSALLSVLTAIFVYKEKLAPSRLVGVAFGIVSIVFLNL